MARRRSVLVDPEMWLSRVDDLATAAGLLRHGRPAAVASGPIADELEELCGPPFAYRDALMPDGVTVDDLRRWAREWCHAPERHPQT